MSTWLRYLELQAKSRIGLSTGVVVFAVVAVLGAIVALWFFIFAAFIWLAARYDALTAALAMAGAFLLIAIVAAFGCLLSHRRTMTDAKLALASRSSALWMDPRLLGVGLRVGRSIGWRRLMPLFAVAILAAGLAREWLGGRDAAADDDDDKDDD